MATDMRENLLQHTHLRTRIFAVSLLPVVALVIVTIVNYRYLDALGYSAERIMSRNYFSIKAAQQARQVLEENRNRFLAFLFEQKADTAPDLEIDALERAIAVCREHIAEKGEQLIVDSLEEKQRAYGAVAGRVTAAQSPLPTQEFFSLTASIVGDLNALVDLNEKGMELADLNTRRLAERAMRHSLALLCVTILLVSALSYWLSWRVARPINRLSQSLAGYRQGGAYPSLEATGSDEIGLLIEQFNRLFSRLADYDQHNAAILAAEKQKVRQTEEAKSRFVADLSHQLKTPMTSLAMSINLLHEKRGVLTDEKVQILLETAREDCGRLAALLNELVNISRLEAMARPVMREQLDVTNLIRECLRPLEKNAEEKGVGIRLEVEPELPPIALDSLRFPWVITNLVGNALRYTERGGEIVITVGRRQGRYVFECSDTGCGIDPQYLPRIFDRYSQFSEREKLGTIGLGLAIVKEIIEQHGGDISARSRPGQGTLFTFWIPEQSEEIDAQSAADR